MLDGLEALFRGAGGFVLAARCRDGEEMLHPVRKQAPDILVLDLRMPRLSGLEVLRTMRAEQLATRVAVLTAALNEDERRSGSGRGVVLKEMAAYGRPPVGHSADNVPVLDSLQPPAATAFPRGHVGLQSDCGAHDRSRMRPVSNSHNRRALVASEGYHTSTTTMSRRIRCVNVRAGPVLTSCACWVIRLPS